MTTMLTRRFRGATYLCLFVVTAAALFLRLYRLQGLEPGIASDEGWDGLRSLDVLQGERSPVFADREGLGIYAIALATVFLGPSPLALRLPTALASAGTVPALFWLGHLLFGRDENGTETRWRGLVIGGVSSSMLAVSLGATVLGHTSYRANIFTLLLVLCPALLFWGWTRRRWWGVALAGLCAGLLPYSYTSARFTPFLFLLLGICYLQPIRPKTWKRLRSYLPRAALFVGVAGLTAAPILVHYILNPDSFFNSRIQSLSVFRGHEEAPIAALAAVLAANAWEKLSLLLFTFREGCCSPFRDAFSLNWFGTIFFWVGAGTAVWRWNRSPVYRLLPLWALLLLLPSLLSYEHSTMRMVGAAPPIYLLAGVGVWQTYQWTAARIPSAAKSAPLFFGVAVSTVIAVQGAATFGAYFGEGRTDRFNQYDMLWPEFAYQLNARPEERGAVYLIPHVHSGFAYLHRGATPARMFFPYIPELANQSRAILEELEDVSTVRVVDWGDRFAWHGGHEADFLAILLEKHGRYAGGEMYGDFAVHSYEGVSLEQPWVLFTDLQQPVVYQDGITLEGVALGPGRSIAGEQGSSDASRNGSLAVGTLWTTASELTRDYSISLRLYDSENTRVAQDDHVLRKPTEYEHTTRFWSVQERVSLLFWLEAPDDLAAGEYELRIVVYDLETLAPTTEIGVWKPETRLADLRLE